jgi:hypothetical protein
MKSLRIFWPGVAAAVTMGLMGTSATAAPPQSGHLTSQASMIAPALPGVAATPLLTVGETLPGGYRFESIPDGIALDHKHANELVAFVNHETSAVPFPLAPPTSFFDYTNALVSRLVLNKHDASIVEASYVIPSSANYQRFCSNFLATKKHGFERDLLFTNEEATDFVYRTGTAWPLNEPADPRVPEQAGVVVAYDVESGVYKTIYGMGRHNHENSVALPWYGSPAVLSGDDTFSAPASQLYLYTAESAAETWADEGQLWALVSDNPAVNDYGDLTVGGSVSGRFIPVPESIAKGEQTPLENWSNANNVFQFIRVEDIAYDRTNPGVVYVADTGEPRAIANAATGRLQRGPSGTQGPYPNGRIFRLELDTKDPTVVKSLSILIDGDAGGYYAANAALWASVLHQPDNLETTEKSLLIQEDPGSHSNIAAGQPHATAARIWRYDLRTGDLEVVARVDQSQDTSGARLGAWESSGIVDASNAFGPGAFLVDVQAPTLSLDRVVNAFGPNTLLEREGGQLLLLRIPGA